jgi:hypothetical protein
MSGTAAPHRPDRSAGHDCFRRLVHAEWTKLRTVRGWVLGLTAAVVLAVLLGLPTTSSGGTSPCADRPNPERACSAPVGPGGEAVSDSFYFVRQPLDGDGTITVEVTSLTGTGPSDEAGAADPELPELSGGLEPWAKAGLIIKESTHPGSTYAAIMVTGDHGVRLQHDYSHDTAGGPGAASASSPRWLRLTRTGDLVAGYESNDGADWTEVGTVRLDGLPSTVEVGLFVASPQHVDVDQQLLGVNASGGPTRATAVFDQLSLQDGWPQDAWHGGMIGDDPVVSSLGGFEESGGTFTVSGTGDIAPAVASPGQTIEQSLVGTFAALMGVIVVATMFITAEYRRGLIHATLAASPRRARVLAAKALVIGTAAFAAGLVAALVAVELAQRMARSSGNALHPISTSTEVRVVVGTAALAAVTAVLALATGAVLRHSAATVTAVIGAIVVPYILATASVLPEGPADWLLRLTPAAAFAIQQTITEYPQVSNLYAPANGYFPLAPWTGFAVLCAYTAAALVLAARSLHQRDA